MSRASAALPAVVLLTLLTGACADDGVPDATPSRSVTTAPTTVTATVATTSATTATTATSPAPPPAPTTTGPSLPDVVAVAELGYPRDLLDRGRVNVVITRSGDEPLVVHDHQLRVDGFTPAPPEERRIVIPPDGQRVAVQAVFGEATDCDAPTPLAASLLVHYTFGDDADVHAGAIELDDTATLAEIRERYCTARRVLAENDISLGEPTLAGETFAVELTVTRATGDAALIVHAIQGTVLFGVESPYEQGAPERSLRPEASELVLPLTFDVNRCDPHAVAETTRKKGLVLWIALDGAAPQPVDIDIASIDDELEEILNRCKARIGQ